MEAGTDRANLKCNLAANDCSNYRVIVLALSDECGTEEIVLDHCGGRAGLKSARTGERTARTGERTAPVHVATLDSLDLPAPDLVKIDLEGAESRVLHGMMQTLAGARPALIVEIHGEQEQPVRELLREACYDATRSTLRAACHMCWPFRLRGKARPVLMRQP